MNIKTATKEEKKQWLELCIARKKKKQQIKSLNVQDHLYKLGHTF